MASFEPQSPEPSGFADPATTFTVRYHRGRMLALSAASFLAWVLALYLAEGLSWPYKDLLLPVIAVGPIATLIYALASFNQPYLAFDAAGRTIRGPGGSWFARIHPRTGRTGASYTMRGAWIFEQSARGGRRLLFHRCWAHPADWATLTALLNTATPETRLPPDWVRLDAADLGGNISFGINRKPFIWAFIIGLVLTMSNCLGLPFLFRGPDFLRVLAFIPLVPLAIGLGALLLNPMYTLGPRTGTVVVSSRLRVTKVLPEPSYDHLEYSARLGNLYQVRADGKRQIIVTGWTMDPKAWKHFTGQLQERAR